MREEDASNIGFIDRLGADKLCIPHAVIRRNETRCMKTNQTTGLKAVEQCKKGMSMITSVRQQLVTQKECMKIESARPITSREHRDRYSHGIRHFQGVLHSKIKDLALEIENLHRRCNDAQLDYIYSVTYEAKAKELASEITQGQEYLADLNLAFNFADRVGNIEELQEEARQLEDLNISERQIVEGLFNERKLKEDFINQKNNNEQFTKNISSSLYDESDGKGQYICFNNRLFQSSKAIGFWNKQIGQYNKLKDKLTQKLKAKMPFIGEIISLETKLLNLKGKWNVLNESSTLRLNKEREIILETVKLDNSITSEMECNLRSLTKRIKNLQDVLDHVRLSENEILQAKEPIDIYLTSFDNEKDNQIKKINLFKSKVNHYLSELIIKFSSLPTMTDLNLHENKIEETEMSGSIDFQEEHRKVSDSLKKLELMEYQQSKNCKFLEEISNNLKDNLEEYKSQTKINEFKAHEKKLKNQIFQLKEDRTTHLKELEMAKAQIGKLEKEISENEKHKDLLALEKKYSCLEEDIILMNQIINEMKTTTSHLLEIRAKTLNFMGSINSGLINHYESEGRFSNH